MENYLIQSISCRGASLWANVEQGQEAVPLVLFAKSHKSACSLSIK